MCVPYHVTCLAHGRFCYEVTMFFLSIECVSRAGPIWQWKKQANCLHSFGERSPHLYEVVILISTKNQPRMSKVKPLAQSCQAHEWQSWDSEPLLWQSVGAELKQAPLWCWEGSREVKDTCFLPPKRAKRRVTLIGT